MAIGKLKIGKLNVIFVFRHRWEKGGDPYKDFKTATMFREWELGLWFKKNKMIGIKGFTKPNTHLVNTYMLGINLLVCKAWVDWDINGLHIEE
jgi:hypothetical protein